MYRAAYSKIVVGCFLWEWGEQVIGFVEDTTEEFTNNQRERDLRMVNIKEKISGCFRSEAGAITFCAIRSVVSMFRKQSHFAFALRCAFTPYLLRYNPYYPSNNPQYSKHIDYYPNNNQYSPQKSHNSKTYT